MGLNQPKFMTKETKVSKKDITSLRGCIVFVKGIGELITVTEEVNPELEISTISKGLDNGPAFLFEKVK